MQDIMLDVTEDTKMRRNSPYSEELEILKGENSKRNRIKSHI